jgi:hypothetical protein
MGTKARNATYISGNEAGKIAREVVEVEKRRAVKSTDCNARSSRSHCMVGCNHRFLSLVGCLHVSKRSDSSLAFLLCYLSR